MVDGSLKFDTKFDTDGVNKATDMVNKSVSRMYQRVKQAFSGKEVDQSSAKMAPSHSFCTLRQSTL